MLESRFKAPWRVVNIEGGPSVAEVYAAAGGNPVTIGFALGSGSAAAATRLGGVTVSVLPWGACALAATRLTRDGSRLLGVIAKSAVNGLRVARPGEDVVPISRKNAESAIPALDTTSVLLYGNTTAWWPLGEALAMAGTWMRRRSWADTSKRVRFVAGAGTTPAVFVVIDASRSSAVPVLSTDFGAGEFLATDWETWAVVDAPPIDVSDFRFEPRVSPGEGFFFAVDAAGPGGDGGGDDGDEGDCSLTLTPQIVRSLLNNAVSYVAAESFPEGSRDIIRSQIVSVGVSQAINLGGRASCAGYYASIIKGEISPPGGGGGGGDGEDQPPSDGDYVRMSVGGVAQWVPTTPFACPLD